VEVRGQGFTAAVPQDWLVARSGRKLTVRSGSSVVSVTLFPLRKAYDESQFDAAAKTLDRVAATLAGRSGAKIDKAETVTISHRQARSYVYGARRIGFVLAGRDEFQLYCSDAWSSACDLLYSTFTLAGPQA
jgi:hypothetical protein